MPILFLDFETYYDDEYSLRRMTPPEYILDPRFETICCAVKVDGGPTQWVDGPDFAAWLSQYDPPTVTTVTFNALFDNCVLAWRYGFVPARMLCAMRMAVALRGHKLRSTSLATVAAVLGVGTKGDEINLSKGKRRAELMNDPVTWARFKNYAVNDTNLCAGIFDQLIPEFPASERKVMDRVLRCAVVPRFRIDAPMLRQHLDDLDAAQERALIEAGAPTTLDSQDKDEVLKEFASSLRSTGKFEKILQELGVEIAYKASTSDPERLIPAFAKTDQFMSDLLEHEDETVRSLANARLGLRSTIERTRGERIMKIATQAWPNTEPMMPIPLRYSGAHTHRLSGEWSINMQNLPAGRGGNKSKLRRALIAPPGYKVIVADLSQIECRITAFICGQQSLLDVFANKKDPYSLHASDVFGFPVNKNDHPIERFIGKTGVLGLGFGCGADKFYNMVIRSARMLGLPMDKLMSMWTPQLAQRTVDVYRMTHSNIKSTWYHLDSLISTVWSGASNTVVKFGPCLVGPGYVELPNRMKLLYEVLPPDDRGARYRYGKTTHPIYGAKLLENIVQALARIVVMNAALRLWDRGYHFALQAHDELAFIVPDADTENARHIILEEMRRPPGWAPLLPLDAEVGVGQSYGEAK